MSGAGHPSVQSIAASLGRGRWWIAATVVVSATLTWWLVTSTPTRWMSSARLEIDRPGETAAEVAATIRSGGVLERLRAHEALTTRLGLGPGDRLEAMGRLLSEQVRVVAGGGSDVWLTVWHIDGGLARDLVTAILEAAAAVELEDRSRRAEAEIARLESERLELVARLDTMARADDAARAGEPRWPGIVGEEVDRARIRTLAERLARIEAELELSRARAADPQPSWRVTQTPAAFQHPLPYRLGGPVVAALTLPVLVAALAWLLHDHRRA